MINVPSDFPADEVQVVVDCLQGSFQGDDACKLHSHIVVGYYAQRQHFAPACDPVPDNVSKALMRKRQLIASGSISWLEIAQIVLTIAEQILTALIKPPAPPPVPTSTVAPGSE